MIEQIKLFDNWYIGFRAGAPNDVPLGFLTPGGTDSAALKRKATVDYWSGKTIPPLDGFDASTPIEGFKISQSIRRRTSWGSGGNVVWRIEDPRGFELEIGSSNMMKLLECCTVKNGEFIGKLAWGRVGATNVLISVESELYKKAIQDTKILNSSRLSVKSLTPGCWVVFSNTERMQYAGEFQFIQTNTLKSSFDSRTDSINLVKRHVFLHSLPNSKLRMYKLLATPKFVSIEPGCLDESVIREMYSTDRSYKFGCMTIVPQGFVAADYKFVVYAVQERTDKYWVVPPLLKDDARSATFVRNPFSSHAVNAELPRYACKLKLIQKDKTEIFIDHRF